jgi:hypothetical protein
LRQAIAEVPVVGQHGLFPRCPLGAEGQGLPGFCLRR